MAASELGTAKIDAERATQSANDAATKANTAASQIGTVLSEASLAAGSANKAAEKADEATAKASEAADKATTEIGKIASAVNKANEASDAAKEAAAFVKDNIDASQDASAAAVRANEAALSANDAAKTAYDSLLGIADAESSARSAALKANEATATANQAVTRVDTSIQKINSMTAIANKLEVNSEPTANLVQNGENYQLVVGIPQAVIGDEMVSEAYNLVQSMNGVIDLANEATQNANTAKAEAEQAAADARAESNEAAQYARDEAEQAVDYAQTETDSAVGRADTATQAAKSAANLAKASAGKIDYMTLSAVNAPYGAAGIVNLGTNPLGGYDYRLSIPSGRTPELSFEVTTVNPNEPAEVTKVTGIPEAPVIHLNIPKGDTGSVDNLTINGEPVHSGNIVITPASIGAMAVGDMPDIDFSGLVPNTRTINGQTLDADVTLTPDDIGAESAKLVYRDVTATFAADSRYPEYPIRATFAADGAKAGMIAHVVLSLDDAGSGNYSPVCETAQGEVRIWCREQPESLVAPTVTVWRGAGSPVIAPPEAGEITVEEVMQSVRDEIASAVAAVRAEYAGAVMPYKAGDVIDRTSGARFIYAGFLQNSSTEIIFMIPLERPVSASKTTVTVQSLSVRGGNKGLTGTDLTSADLSVISADRIVGLGVRVTIRLNTTLDAVTGTCVTGMVGFRMEFS